MDASQKRANRKPATFAAAGLVLVALAIVVVVFGEDEAPEQIRIGTWARKAPSPTAGARSLSPNWGVRYSQEHLKKIGDGPSTDTVDVLKSDTIITETPKGYMRLNSYFASVEKEINNERASRKADIAAVQAQMARDLAFNRAARQTMKKKLQAKMAWYAKKAKSALKAALARTQRTFKQQAALANKRQLAYDKRARETLRRIKSDRRQNQHNLKMAVHMMQRGLTAWAQSTNKKIDKMNKHVAANAAHIASNAAHAQRQLNKAMARWSVQVEHAKHIKDRAALKKRIEESDRRNRVWAMNKINALVSRTQAQFMRTHKKMAKQRHSVDLAVVHASSRFSAALNAQKAVEDKRFKMNMSNVLKTRVEASKRIARAKREFKVGLLQMSQVVKQQQTKMNARINNLGSVVASNKANQLKVNRQVQAEMARMVALGNKRQAEHARSNAALHAIVKRDRAEIDGKLSRMAARFNARLSKVRAQIKKDRAAAENALGGATRKLWAALQRRDEQQAAINKAMDEEQLRMHEQMMARIRFQKMQFAKKVSGLGRTVAQTAQKMEGEMEVLTGVEKRNAARSRKGRQLIRRMARADKADMKNALRKAIQKGEQAACKLLAKSKTMNKTTQQMMKFKLQAEVSRLAKQTHGRLGAIAMASKKARADLKRQMKFAVNAARRVAARDLKSAVASSEKRLAIIMRRQENNKRKDAKGMAKLNLELGAMKRSVQRRLRDAVAGVARAQLAQAAQVQKKIKKTNMRVTAYAKRVKDEAKTANLALRRMVVMAKARLGADKRKFQQMLNSASAADARRSSNAMKYMRKELAKAQRESSKKFGATFVKLANMRAAAGQKLGAATSHLNNKLSQAMALNDARFSKTVKKLHHARAHANAQVRAARRAFKMGLAGVTSHIKNVESRLTGEIEVATGELMGNKIANMQANRRVAGELRRIVRLSDKRFSSSKRARGQLRHAMNKHKREAAMMVKKLAAQTRFRLAKVRRKMAKDSREYARDLSKATTALYTRMEHDRRKGARALKKLNAAQSLHEAANDAALRKAKTMFSTRLTMLHTTIVAQDSKNRRSMHHLTGVVEKINKASIADRRLIKDQNKAMQADLNRKIVRSISLGQARAKALEARLSSKTKFVKRSIQVQLTERTERMAETVYKAIKENRPRMADNYLSVKAYATAARDEILDVTMSGKKSAAIHRLSSIGDFLKTVAAMAPVPPKARNGIGLGRHHVTPLYSTTHVKCKGAFSKLNGVINEYSQMVTQVRQRWPSGLGKYLLDQLQVAMPKHGVLQVGKLSGKRGTHVFINARQVGLTNKVHIFYKIATSMRRYRTALAALSSQMTIGSKLKNKKGFFVPPPVWNGA